MKISSEAAKTALATLAILQTVMLFAMMTRTEPHPPFAIVLFGLGPFLSLSLSLTAAAWLLGAGTNASSRIACLLAAAAALISFGPQKWGDPMIGQIWPAVLSGEIAAATLIIVALVGAKGVVTSKKEA